MTQTTADWVRAAAKGDHAAFEMLVSQHAALVTGVAYSRCGDFTLSEDIAQEAFIEAWKELATIREPEKFQGWICTIARRRAIDAVRNAKSMRVDCSLNELPVEVHGHNQLTPEASMSQQQECDWVWSMLARLPEIYREPMILFYRCEESTRDVAIALGETEATIRQRLKRGRDMLRTDMAESIRNTITATAPKAAFAAMVMGSLPSSTYAAGAAATTAATAKASSTSGVTAASAIGGAVLGPLIGITGGVFGTWMSWKNCEYASQQRFILRQALLFVVGLTVFGILLAILVSVRLQGIITNDATYGRLLIGLIIISQGLNVVWIWRGIRGYQRIGKEAQSRGEPIRQSVQHRIDALRQQTQVTHSDGSVTYEAFRWNAGGWFGSCVGCIAWMLPLSAISFWFGSISLAILICLAFLFAIAITLMAWRFRERIHPYWAYQALVVVMGLMTMILMVGIQFMGNAETQEYLTWTPWAWCILLIFPMFALQLWWIRRSFQRNMLVIQGTHLEDRSS